MYKKRIFSFLVIFFLILASLNVFADEEKISETDLSVARKAIVAKLEEAGVKKFNVQGIEGKIKSAFTKLEDKSNLDKIINDLSTKLIFEYKEKNRFFNPKKTNVLVALIVLGFFIVYFIFKALKGVHLFIRPIAGLQAIDEAVGRATEMGRDVLYVPGIYDITDLPTLASVSILGHVAKKTAEYETNITMPVAAPIIYSTAKEVIKEAHLQAGRPDTYREDCVRYLTGDQFAYAGGVCGIMVREKPATIFYMGTFYAESLILAETGHHVNAIQIAGTTQTSQLPFFVAGCDYTLLGEEMYAASAYFSREPIQLGSLKGQDYGKMFAMVSIVVGMILTSIASFSGNEWFNFFKELFKVKS